MEHQNEKAADETAANVEDKDLPLMVWGESKWGECRYPDESGN